MIALIKTDQGWEPMTYAWQTQAKRWAAPACAHRCRCGTGLRAMTPAALSTLIAAHRERCR